MIYQLESAECGAASLAMILAYFGYQATLDELRYLCGVSRDGSNASNIMKAAKSFGLRPIALACSMSELPNQIVPHIVFWDNNHFLVVVRYTRRHVVINNPASGRLVLSHDEFERHYSGYCFCFETTAAFAKRSLPRESLVAKLLNIFTCKSGFWIGFGYLAITAGVILFVPLLLVVFFRTEIRAHLWLQTPMVWALVTMMSLGFGCFYLGIDTVFRALAKKKLEQSYLYLSALVQQPIHYFEHHLIHELLSRIGMKETLVSTMVYAVLRLMMVTTGLFFMFWLGVFQVGWMVSMIVLLGVMVAITLVAVDGLITQYIRQKYPELELQGCLFYAGLGLTKTVGVSQRSQILGDVLLAFRRVVSHSFNPRASVLRLFLPYVVIPATGFFLIYEFAYEIVHGMSPVAGFLVFVVMSLVVFPMVSFIGHVPADIQHMTGLMRYTQLDVEPVSSMQPPDDWQAIQGGVVLDGVSFAFNPSSTPIVNDITMRIEPHSMVSISGEENAGKTTLLQLISGMYTPTKGCVYLDSRPLQDCSSLMLSQSMYVAMTDTHFFPGSLA